VDHDEPRYRSVGKRLIDEVPAIEEASRFKKDVQVPVVALECPCLGPASRQADLAHHRVQEVSPVWRVLPDLGSSSD
jgi:hypothetical protein